MAGLSLEAGNVLPYTLTSQLPVLFNFLTSEDIIQAISCQQSSDHRALIGASLSV